MSTEAFGVGWLKRGVVIQMNKQRICLILTSVFIWSCSHSLSKDDIVSIFEKEEFTQMHETVLDNKVALLAFSNDSSGVSIDLKSNISPHLKKLMVNLTIERIDLLPVSDRITYVFYQDWESFQVIEYVPADSSYFNESESKDFYEIQELGNHFYYHAFY
ncbi:MAG: hypothetical protein JJ895_03810 [Balneolaceae bacterium]|nr:hypothetical protein [Balneolaceae bacterium]